MTNTIQITATMRDIPADRLAEFRERAAEAMELTRTEPGTLQ